MGERKQTARIEYLQRHLQIVDQLSARDLYQRLTRQSYDKVVLLSAGVAGDLILLGFFFLKQMNMDKERKSAELRKLYLHSDPFLLWG